jgi:hypothetical protein
MKKIDEQTVSTDCSRSVVITIYWACNTCKRSGEASGTEFGRVLLDAAVAHNENPAVEDDCMGDMRWAYNSEGIASVIQE